ncbi:hypothetical protein PLESTM_000183100 [Pleodorina starrii]|nr:hypothetical protein PLESTM_000183100 [Pleodorina starrii]
MSCIQIFRALSECQRRHPRDQEFVCQHLTSKAGWCLFSGICPKEVIDLEDCVGTTNATRIGAYVPPRCEPKAQLLAACIEGQRSAAERRTNECPSKDRKSPQAQQPHNPDGQA